MFFFFNDTATTEIYTLSLHDALPICNDNKVHSPTNELIDLAYLQLIRVVGGGEMQLHVAMSIGSRAQFLIRSEEHTSELQSRQYLVCRLLLEKKNTQD